MADVKNEEFTEIRCQKKMKGGLSYEIILAEPVAVTPLKLPSSSRKNASVENIEEKLKAAEKRRLSLEAEKKTDSKQKHERQLHIRLGILEKVDQLVSEVQRRLEQAQIRRELFEKEKLEKLRSHEWRAEMVRQNKARLSRENDTKQTAVILGIHLPID
jgi:chromosome segregation ATPase